MHPFDLCPFYKWCASLLAKILVILGGHGVAEEGHTHTASRDGRHLLSCVLHLVHLDQMQLQYNVEGIKFIIY